LIFIFLRLKTPGFTLLPIKRKILMKDADFLLRIESSSPLFTGTVCVSSSVSISRS
jgi:hypothetical protein